MATLSTILAWRIPWTVAHQALPSMEFCRQECWSGLSCPPPGDLSDSGIKPLNLVSPELAGGFFITGLHAEYIM